jgi:hypothetical protein
MEEDPGEVEAPFPTRPDLKPDDPRGTASPTNDFTIVGSIDNESVFSASDGESHPMRW